TKELLGEADLPGGWRSSRLGGASRRWREFALCLHVILDLSDASEPARWCSDLPGEVEAKVLLVPDLAEDDGGARGCFAWY
ncbi:hypothetical protein Dimus_018562, partial [Dionaea muscipula]